jgi:hypothetical protein
MRSFSSRSSYGGRGYSTPRRSFGGRGGDDSFKRRLFDKLVRDETATLSTTHQVFRFIEGMENFSSKAELIDKLDDARNCGMQRIPEILGFMDSLDDIKDILIRLLRLFLDKELSKPMYLPKRNKVLMAIYISPSLTEMLLEQKAASSLEQEAAEWLCLFLQEISKVFMEVRKSESVMTMAKALRNRGDIDAATLCAVLLVDERSAATKRSLHLKRNLVKVLFAG